MLTTDVTCLKDINADAVLKLQAGFRPYYAMDIYANEESFLECLLEAIDLHVSDICSELGIMRVDFKDMGECLISGNKTPFGACRRQRISTPYYR